MEKIDFLLERLDNRIPQSLARKIDTLDDLQEKLEASQGEYDENPTQDNKDSLDECKEYISSLEREVVADLQNLVDKKESDAKKIEASKKEEKPETPKQEPAPKASESQEEKKESSGTLGLVIGAVLLIGSLGAINYFKNNK